MKKMIKSYRFWVTLSGAVGILFVAIAKLFGYTISSAPIEEVIMAICGVLMAIGIVKKPDKKTKQTESTDKELNEEQNNKN